MWAGNARPDGSNAASLQSRWEPPGHQRALQKHSVSDHNKLMDFDNLLEITEMKKLLRMTDVG